MITDILQSDFPGVNGTVVSNYFNSNGFNGARLGFNSSNDNVDSGVYSGSYGGSQSGSFEFTVVDSTVSGTWYSPAWGEYGYVSGSVDNETGNLYLTSSDEDGVPISFTGVIDNESADGSWSMPYYGNGSFSTELA